MGQGNHGGRLSQLATPWVDLDQAHGGTLPALGAARPFFRALPRINKRGYVPPRNFRGFRNRSQLSA
jgi:hypothetical protein